MPDITIPLWVKILIGLILLAILASIIYSTKKIGGLRTLGIVFMSLTAVFTLMGGAGTSCVALNPTGFGPAFAAIAPMQWLYIVYVLVTLAIGVMGVRAVVMLIKGTVHAYRDTMIALVAGIVVGGIHIFTSRLLRGSSMPVDMVVYVTVLTLIIFLLFRIPGIWKRVDFEDPARGKKTGKQAAAFAMIATGLLTLTIQYLMAPTHTIGGINYADVWHLVLTFIGSGLIVSSPVLLLIDRLATARRASMVEALE